jgi:S-adenosylmethionine:tRNA ribosyltransferase-isomerase
VPGEDRVSAADKIEPAAQCGVVVAASGWLPVAGGAVCCRDATAADAEGQQRPVLNTSELEYELPEGCIATVAAEPRDSARLMVLAGRGAGEASHETVREIARHLRAGDLLVFNTTRVLPARLEGVRADTSGGVEGLFLCEVPHEGAARWKVLLRAKRARVGVRVALEAESGEATGVSLLLIEQDKDEAGAWLVEVEGAGAGESAAGVLGRVGRTPLPPYIARARRQAGTVIADAVDRERYQTVYADEARPGSVAAPTAGLHFTPALLAELGAMGVQRADVILDVGTGTFRPVETATVEEHPMHSERCVMSREAVEAVRRAKAEGRRVIAVGTTSARTLEAYAAAMEGGGAAPESLETSLLITPGYRWRWVDGMLTNFHLPRSTLLAMVGSLVEGGLPRLKGVYAEAIARGYRFYSYGDAMIVLP